MSAFVSTTSAQLSGIVNAYACDQSMDADQLPYCQLAAMKQLHITCAGTTTVAAASGLGHCSRIALLSRSTSMPCAHAMSSYIERHSRPALSDTVRSDKQSSVFRACSLLSTVILAVARQPWFATSYAQTSAANQTSMSDVPENAPQRENGMH